VENSPQHEYTTDLRCRLVQQHFVVTVQLDKTRSGLCRWSNFHILNDQLTPALSNPTTPTLLIACRILLQLIVVFFGFFGEIHLK
jgi:hypothetical protein